MKLVVFDEEWPWCWSSWWLFDDVNPWKQRRTESIEIMRLSSGLLHVRRQKFLLLLLNGEKNLVGLSLLGDRLCFTSLGVVSIV
jgi:hypothetical protein